MINPQEDKLQGDVLAALNGAKELKNAGTPNEFLRINNGCISSSEAKQFLQAYFDAACNWQFVDIKTSSARAHANDAGLAGQVAKGILSEIEYQKLNKIS